MVERRAGSGRGGELFMGDEDGPAEFTNADHLPPLLSGECISILAASCGRCISKMVSHPLRVSVFANAYRHRPKYRFNRNFATKRLTLFSRFI